jgi:hypothetical protein
MNISLYVEQFNINNVFFNDSVKNTIMKDSNFIKIIYSEELCALNGICVEFNLPIIKVDKLFNKVRCSFDKQLCSELIQTFNKIEFDIISKYSNINKNKNKQPKYRISEQLQSGNIKLLNMISNINNQTFIIKISGLWETETDFGLTYKFTQCILKDSIPCKH